MQHPISDIPAAGVPALPESLPADATGRAGNRRGVRAAPASARAPDPRAAKEPPPELDPEALESIVEDLNHLLSGPRRIRFQISSEGNDLVVQIIDRASDEVIRSIPPEKLLSFRDQFREVTGLLIDDRA